MPNQDSDQREAVGSPIDEDLRKAAHLRVAGWKVFGRFTLETRLGHGGMSVVWRAHDELLDEAVALKFIPKVVARDSVAVDDLRQKTARARLLDHPNIARVNDFMRDNTLATVSIEYVEGATLEQQRMEQPGQVIRPSALAPVIGRLCEALDYAHQSAGIVHGSLKPTNVIIGPDGEAKITDFCIACSLADARRRIMKGAEPVLAARFYQSPHQADGDTPSVADDIYSLGAVIYEALLGEPPSSLVDVVTQMCLHEATGLDAPGGGRVAPVEPVPAAWKKAVAGCLARDPLRRPGSWKEVADLFGLG